MSTPTTGVTSGTLEQLQASYTAARRRLDTAQHRMRATIARPHAPLEARRAGRDLTVALREASTLANRALQLSMATTPAAPRRGLLRRKATRSLPADVQVWSTELVRLAQVGAWLSTAIADDPSLLVPTVVRVGSRAATGPHIAGMVAEPKSLVAATLHQPRIGVDLRRVVDGIEGPRALPGGETSGAPDPAA
jgi:hypothetical protein